MEFGAAAIQKNGALFPFKCFIRIHSYKTEKMLRFFSHRNLKGCSFISKDNVPK